MKRTKIHFCRLTKGRCLYEKWENLAPHFNSKEENSFENPIHKSLLIIFSVCFFFFYEIIHDTPNFSVFLFLSKVLNLNSDIISHAENLMFIFQDWAQGKKIPTKYNEHHSWNSSKRTQMFESS